MKESYMDITDELGPPMWWDEEGVPRYCPFHPNHSNDVYADEVALVRIVCQNCKMPFSVAMSHGQMSHLLSVIKIHSLAHRIKEGTLHYGDPPNYGCCPPGPTMSSITVEVMEYWRRHRDRFSWERDKDLEVEIEDPWAWTKAPWRLGKTEEK